MRWVSKLLALAATGALGSNALEASIFTFSSSDHGLPNAFSRQQAVSEDLARLVLDLRTKSSLASILGKSETATVDRLNQFAETEFTLFGASGAHDAQKKNIVFLEGLEHEVGSAIRKSQTTSLFVPHASQYLVVSSMDSLLEGDNKAERCIYPGSAGEAGPNTAESPKECLSRDPVLSHGRGLFDENLLDLIDSVNTWVSRDQMTTASRISFKNAPSRSKLVIRSIESLFQHFAHESSSSNREITAVVLPSIEGHRGPAQSQKRETKVRSGSSTSMSNTRDTLPKAAQELGIHSNLAPVCHASNSSCAEATNNCSAHGYCYLKSGSGAESASGNCYACRCQQTVVRKNDGTMQKIQWGGPACEKKDISSPFFLIAGVSILAIVMVGSAVGLLFGMGQEELPSVIAAGVGASKAQT